MNRDDAVACAATIEGWMSSEELAWLCDTASKIGDAGTWVEVGVYAGRSLFATAMGLPQRSRLIAVDHFRGDPAWPAGQIDRLQNAWCQCCATISAIRKNRPDLLIELMLQPSVDAAVRFLPYTVDCVFIDGSYARADVVRDLRAWLPNVQPRGGIICGHDGHRDTVWSAAQECCAAVERGPGTIWFSKR